MPLVAEPHRASDEPPWLDWVRRLQAVAQAGLTYSRDPFDVERYREVRRIAAEIAAERSGGEVAAIEELFSSARGYPTPKIDVRAAVIVGNRILLVRERDDGRWALPGGWADVGETAAEAVARETREEAGLEVRAVKLIALYDRQRRGHPRHPEYSYKAIFHCDPVGRTVPRAGHENDGADFFGRADLPDLSLPRVTPHQVELAFAHQADPALPTEFD
jgi:ADP-ribose pyrophosphatase YjhB (NUDIX family)